MTGARGEATFQGAVAVVTGATRGLGHAIAVELAQRGAHVVAVGRSTDAAPHRSLPGTLESVQKDLEAVGSPFTTVRADLGDPAQVDVVTASVLDWAGRCDLLVNNASYTPAGTFLDIPATRWTTGMNITVLAPVRLCQGLLPGMLERGEGRILNIGSVAGAHRGATNAGAAGYRMAGTPLLYAVTKGALERLTTGLDDEFGDRGIACNNMRAGQMSTEGWHLMREATGFDDPVEAVHTPQEAARAACWMLEQPTSFRGQILDFADLVQRGALPARG
jgi:3-oxoacyl-[acyl-carrier protein] reductase